MTQPFPWVIYAANFIRMITRSTIYPTVSWVTAKSWAGVDGNIVIAGSDYYNEAVTHVILNQGTPNLIYYVPNPATSDPEGDEQALNDVITSTQSACSNATRIVPITQAHSPYNSDFIVSAVYLNDTHSGVARVTFAPGVNSASFTLRGVPFTVPRPTGELGAWQSFGPILDLDNLTFDDANALTFDQANVLKLGSSNAMSFDEANALTFDQANALPD